MPSHNKKFRITIPSLFAMHVGEITNNASIQTNKTIFYIIYTNITQRQPSFVDYFTEVIFCSNSICFTYYSLSRVYILK